MLRTRFAWVVLWHRAAVQTVPCPHCAEPVRPTATFCLACDRPIADTERGLSVADAVPTSVGRPLVGLLVGLGCVALLAGAAYGGVRIFHHAHTAEAQDARADVRRGLTLVVSAESGRSGACDQLAAVVAPPAPRTLSACRAIVGDDRNAKVDAISVGEPHLATGTGTVRVKATIADAGGTRSLDETVHLVQAGRHWRMTWNGKPTATASPT